MKRLLSIFFLSFSLVAKTQDTINTEVDTLGGGLRKDCESDILMYLAPKGYETEKSTNLLLYPSWDLTRKYLRRDWTSLLQGKQGSCTSFAIAFAVTIQRNIDNFLLSNRTDLVQYSPAFIFNVAKNKYPDPFKSNCREGISFIDAFLVVRDQGISSLTAFPYNGSDNGCISAVNSSALTDAAKTKIAIFQRPFRTVENFKRILVDTPFYPICIGVFLNNEYDNAMVLNQGRWINPGISTGKRMHALLVVGFDESKHAFKVMDWQGKNKGDSGFLWMDYSLISNEHVVFDAYICSHQTEYIDYRIGSRTSYQMNEYSDIPYSVNKSDLNSDFKNDKISFWIKAGYYTYKNVFKVYCSYVSDEKNRATFRISNKATGEIIKDDVIIREGGNACFAYEGVEYKLSLVEIANRGSNIFRKAAVLTFTRNSSCR